MKNLDFCPTSAKWGGTGSPSGMKFKISETRPSTSTVRAAIDLKPGIGNIRAQLVFRYEIKVVREAKLWSFEKLQRPNTRRVPFSRQIIS